MKEQLGIDAEAMCEKLRIHYSIFSLGRQAANIIEKLLVRISVLEAASKPSEWQPIETAPRDGAWFIAVATAKGWGATRIVCYRYPDDRLPTHGEGNVWPSAPTHWMPLPKPPEPAP